MMIGGAYRFKEDKLYTQNSNTRDSVIRDLVRALMGALLGGRYVVLGLKISWI